MVRHLPLLAPPRLVLWTDHSPVPSSYHVDMAEWAGMSYAI